MIKTLFLTLFLACLSTLNSERVNLSKKTLIYSIGTRTIVEEEFIFLSKRQRKLLILKQNEKLQKYARINIEIHQE